MASAFAHAFTAYTFKNLTTNPLLKNKFLFFVIASSIVPDLDVLAFRFDIAYGDIWGHRGMTHSLLFAFLWSVFLWFVISRSSDFKHVALISKTSLTAIAVLFLSTGSHGLLDAMTNGGLGVAFFSPFDTTRYFLPWQPIQVSPIGVGAFFSSAGLRIIISELIWVGLPLLALLTLLKLKNRIQ